MTIRPITILELEELRTLAIRCYDNAFSDQNERKVLDAYYAEAFSTTTLAAQLNNPNSFWYFLNLGDKTLGYLKLNVAQAQTEFQEDDGIELERIYIAPEYLNKGYGASLLKFAVLKGKELGKSYIWLGVWEHNPSAIRFYKRHGFKITGTHDYNMIAEIQTDYIMQKPL